MKASIHCCAHDDSVTMVAFSHDGSRLGDQLRYRKTCSKLQG